MYMLYVHNGIAETCYIYFYREILLNLSLQMLMPSTIIQTLRKLTHWSTSTIMLHQTKLDQTLKTLVMVKQAFM